MTLTILASSLQSYAMASGTFVLAWFQEERGFSLERAAEVGGWMFSSVPTLYAALLQVPVEDCDLSSLRYGICGAAPMPVELFKTFEKRTGRQILEDYGVTESVCVASLNPRDGERRVCQIGVRIPYQEMKTAHLDAEGNFVGDCQVGENGTVVIRGPNVLTGDKRSSDDEEAFLDDGWLITGDLDRVDGDGYIWLTGRSKDVIIRGTRRSLTTGSSSSETAR